MSTTELLFLQMTNTPLTNDPVNKLLNKKNKRRSLVSIVSTAFFLILSIFVITNSLIVLRFVDFQEILSLLANETLPEVELSGQTYAKANNLNYLSERLINAKTQAFRRIAYEKIKNTISQINQIELEKNKDVYIRRQLTVISNEFYDLDLLVEQRIQFQKIVKSKTKEMYQLHESALAMKNKRGLLDSENKKAVLWAIDFSELIAITGNALTLERLVEVRQLQKNMERRFELLLQESNFAVANSKDSPKKITQQLQSVLFAEKGLFPSRIKELRSIGKSTGRGNFVSNLINDYSQQVQFSSIKLNRLVINEIDSTKIHIKEQTRIVTISAVLSVLFLIGVIYFLRVKIIKRLTLLSHNVLRRLAGKIVDLNLEGNDEISDIAESFNYFAEKVEEQKEKLQALSLTDGLTGIANRRALDKQLEQELRFAERHQSQVSILMIDIDSFKAYNDHYGHLAGDDSLKEVAKALVACQRRKIDFVARYGGEEFLFLLPDTPKSGARRIAELILKTILSLKIKHEWSSAGEYLSVSIGLSTYCHEENVSAVEIISRADRALFKAKEKGKNCCVSYKAENEISKS